MFYINGNVGGFHQKIADTGLFVFHHQLAGVVVVFLAAVAHLCQQVINLVAQAALGQRHVEDGVFLVTRNSGFQAIQLVEIECKAHGGDAGVELPCQQVVAAALKHRSSQTGQVTLEHQAVVIFHITRQRKVHGDFLPLTGQLAAQTGQFGQRLSHLLIFHQCTGAGEGLLHRAGQFQQGTQVISVGQADFGTFLPQTVGALSPDLLQQSGPQSFLHAQCVQQAGEESHVGQFQSKFGTAQCQRVQRQQQLIPHILLCEGAHALQTHLVDLHEGVALPAGAVDLFVIIIFFTLSGGRLDIFGDGQGHIGLEGQQPSVQIGKGQHLLGGEKASVVLIQAVLFKAAHVIFAVTGPFGQGPQLKSRPFGSF